MAVNFIHTNQDDFGIFKRLKTVCLLLICWYCPNRWNPKSSGFKNSNLLTYEQVFA